MLNRKGSLIAQGKTKKIFECADSGDGVIIESLDDITAGDGAKHDVLEGKAMFATETTCNVFRLLKKHKVPIAFLRQIDRTHFQSLKCTMVPLEVVVRRVALGSFLKRNPGVESGEIFEDLVVEFYLKTSGRVFRNGFFKNGIKMICDDPYIIFMNGSVFLYDPKRPIEKQAPFESFHELDVFDKISFEDKEEYMGIVAKKVFRILERAWGNIGYTLADFKIEFGVTPDGKLVVSDVIDNDSWRVLNTHGEHIDKQLYRDGTDLESIKGKYKKVAQLTSEF